MAETFLIAWRRLEHVPRGARGRLWLFGTARNLLLKAADKQRLHEALVGNLSRELGRITHTDAAPLEGPGAEALRDGISRLPAREREALLLTAWEGFTPKEIAKITRTSANVVRVRLARARNKLRHHLADESRAPQSLGRAGPSSDPSRC